MLVSYLLAPGSIQPPTRVVEAAFANKYVLVIVRATIDELEDKVSRKPYLASRIADQRLAGFIERLSQFAEIVPTPDSIPRVTRDRKDDYLLAPAVLARVDYVVSGDKDLLVLGKVGRTHIVTPTEFVAMLDMSD